MQKLSPSDKRSQSNPVVKLPKEDEDRDVPSKRQQPGQSDPDYGDGTEA